MPLRLPHSHHGGFDRRKITRRALIGGGIAATVGGIGGWFEHDSLRVEQVRIKPYRYEGPERRIAFLADLHMACEHDFHRAMRAVAMVEALKPDLLLLGGDYVSREAGFQDHYVHGFLQACARIAPAAGVLGNHDYEETWPEKLRWHFANVGIPLLINREVTVDGLTVYGFDDALFGVPKSPTSKPHVVLMHEPDYVSFAPKGTLVLCGHSHGGQICLPFGVPVVLPKGGRDIPPGMSWFDERRVYVTRGVGVTAVPLRLFCPPEVTLIHLLRP